MPNSTHIISFLVVVLLLSCSSYKSVEEQTIGEYKASPSDGLGSGLKALNGGLSELGDFGKFTSAITEMLVNEVEIRFYFEENNEGKYIINVK